MEAPIYPGKDPTKPVYKVLMMKRLFVIHMDRCPQDADQLHLTLMHVCLCVLTSESFIGRALLFPREGSSAGWGTASPEPPPDAVTALLYCPFFSLLISAPWSQLVCGTNFKERDDLITSLYSCLY